MLSSDICIAATLGALSHVAFFAHGEDHEEGRPLLALLLLVLSTLFVCQVSMGHVRMQEAAVNVISIIMSFSISLFLSILMYRIFFHRLHTIPGPFLAKTTKLWHVSKVICGSDNFRQLDRLHQEYGDFVRTGGYD